MNDTQTATQAVTPFCGDCLALLPGLPADSVDAVVTDPPGGIEFMGQAWDSSRGGRDSWIRWLAARMAECLRVAMPGAHALVWALPRTSHWTATAMEDAGWIVEDRITHHFGQGFPKHKSKLKPATEDWWLCTKPGGAKWLNIDGCRVGTTDDMHRTRTTALGVMNDDGWEPQRQESDGHPSGRWPPNLVLTHHPDCVPCGERRVKNGTGGRTGGYRTAVNTYGDGKPRGESQSYKDPDGLETVPAFDCVAGCPVALLDGQSGERKGDTPGRKPRVKAAGKFGWSGPTNGDHETAGFADTGGASRFFPSFAWTDSDFAPFLYQSKASRRERNGGMKPTNKVKLRSDLTPEQRAYVARELEAAGVAL